MRKTLIPEELVATYMPPFQLGEPYVIYDIIWLPANGERPREIAQMISLSSYIDGRNGPHFVCGAVAMSVNDFQFLHPETIQELCRGTMEIIKREVETLNAAEETVRQLNVRLGLAKAVTEITDETVDLLT